MKLIKLANDKTTVKISKNKWLNIGKKAGWIGKKAAEGETPESAAQRIINNAGLGMPIWEVIVQFESAIYNNDEENIKHYYPNWTDADFAQCIKLLKPYEDD